MDWSRDKTHLHTNNTRSSVSVQRDVSSPRSFKSHDNKSDNKRYFGNRHNLNFLTIGVLCLTQLATVPVRASDVGGVSATASPIANSSGSVTNQAIQVLQGPYITNTYGGGIQCQGATLNITPYATGTASAQKPWEDYWDSPVYNMIDADDDGVPDNPGQILYYTPNRTGQKDNYNLSLGVSATWSKPLDKKAQEQCKQAVETQIKLQEQTIANKRLDFEIARLKNCGTLLKEGISFHPKSPYYAICADVVVKGKNAITPHNHEISSKVSLKNVSTSSQSLKDLNLSVGVID